MNEKWSEEAIKRFSDIVSCGDRLEAILSDEDKVKIIVM